MANFRYWLQQCHFLRVICANSWLNYLCEKQYFVSLCTAVSLGRLAALLDFLEWREQLYIRYILFTRWGLSVKCLVNELSHPKYICQHPKEMILLQNLTKA